MVAAWELTLQVGVTAVVELSLQLAVAVYVPVPYSLTDDGPSTERPVKVAAGVELPPPPPPPPHVARMNARNARSNEAGRNVTINFLISFSLSVALSFDRKWASLLSYPDRPDSS
jgi:hypothetical protein